MQPVVDHLTAYLDKASPGRMLGLYVTGSAAVGGLRANSDIDVVLVTERSLTHAERQSLLTLLLKISSRLDQPGRPLDFYSIAVTDIVPWTYPPTCDLLYGEWLRETFARGSIPERHLSPDLAVMLTTLLRRFQVLRGPAPGDLLDRIPDADLRQGILDSLPPLLDDLIGDERNVILTLARMLVTISTGEIVSKDEAGRRIESDLPEPARSVVRQATAGYLGLVEDDWSPCQQQVQETADHLAASIRKHPMDQDAFRSH